MMHCVVELLFKTEFRNRFNVGGVAQLGKALIKRRISRLSLPALIPSCNRIVVSTSRCGRDNPGSNPGYSKSFEIDY